MSSIYLSRVKLVSVRMDHSTDALVSLLFIQTVHNKLSTVHKCILYGYVPEEDSLD